jgi:hypothetical protein
VSVCPIFRVLGAAVFYGLTWLSGRELNSSRGNIRTEDDIFPFFLRSLNILWVQGLLVPAGNRINIPEQLILFCRPERKPCMAACSQSIYIYMLKYIYIVEGGTARGTTALVYLQLNSSLYTGTVLYCPVLLEYIRLV